MFDSQKPLEEQITNSGIFLSSEQTKKYECALEPPTALLESLCSSMKKHFGLNLYGFDLIQNVESEKKEWGIIDVNYFPSYRGVSNFDQKILTLLRKLAST
jgi:hypothetical protein